MNTLRFSLKGKKADKTRVFANGKPVRLNGSGEAAIMSDGPIELSICRFSEASDALWFLFAPLYFIISVFGLFDRPYIGQPIGINCSYTVAPVGEAHMSVMLERPVPGFRAAFVTADCPLTERANGCFKDRKAKRRLIFYRLFKIAFWIAALICAAIAVYNAIIGSA